MVSSSLLNHHRVWLAVDGQRGLSVGFRDSDSVTGSMGETGNFPVVVRGSEQLEFPDRRVIQQAGTTEIPADREADC
jgi:hypothetical protein